MTNILVNPPSLLTIANTIITIASAVQKAGDLAWRSASGAPSYDGQFGPKVRYIVTQKSTQVRLDDMVSELGGSGLRRAFLKVDVQGYEMAVLDGAAGLLRDGVIIGLQLELSLVPLYEGAMTYREGLDWADSLGMTLMGLDPVFADPDSGQLLQADVVFFAT